MDILETVEYIKENVSPADLFSQLAEEAVELAHAANKMARIIRGTNPTPKNKDQVANEIIEEFTDIMNVGHRVMDIEPDWVIGDYKMYRWRKRLEEQKNGDTQTGIDERK